MRTLTQPTWPNICVAEHFLRGLQMGNPFQDETLVAICHKAW